MGWGALSEGRREPLGWGNRAYITPDICRRKTREEKINREDLEPVGKKDQPCCHADGCSRPLSLEPAKGWPLASGAQRHAFLDPHNIFF